MGIRVCTIASGSSGNCTYISSQEATVLIDVGAPVGRVKKCLGVLGCGKQLAVAVTHSHLDHVSGVKMFAETTGATVYVSRQTAPALNMGARGEIKLVAFDSGPIMIGDIALEPFEVSHDVPCVGYIASCGNGKVGIATDIGKMTEEVIEKLCGCNLVIIESNHDVEMLKASKKYPLKLKQRILSNRGHLSNDDCAKTCVRLAEVGVKQFLLAHLSEENNYPELAVQTVSSALAKAGYGEAGVEVAGHYRVSSLYEII